MSLPRTALDAVRLKPRERLLFGAALALAKATGAFRHPVRARGDLESMSFFDKVYWLHKAGRPLVSARRGSGLEAFFASQAPLHGLPPGFTPEARATLSAVGDLIDHPFLAASRDAVFEETAELVFGTDLSMGNLECTVMPSASGRLEFTSKSGPPLFLGGEAFRAATSFGERRFSFLATACNHSLDFGAAGVDSTLATLKRDGIAFAGLNASEEAAEEGTIVERNGLRFGLVAFTFGLNGHRAPPDRPGIVNVANLNDAPEAVDLARLERQLRWCRDQKADLLVLHLHWGMEHELYPTPEQVGLAHRLAELGADVIVGHHPHVVQPVEYYRTARDPDRVVPVFYSLGNLLNPFSADFLCRGAVARLTVARGRRADGSVATYIEEASVLGVQQLADEARGRLVLRPVML